MGIAKSPNYTELKLNAACLYTAADGTNLITVGNLQVAAANYANGAAINALSADAWTDVQDINLGKPFQYQIYAGAAGYALRIVMDAETAGDYVRAQWEVDGIAVMDITVGPSKTQNVIPIGYAVIGASLPGVPMFARSRFRVRLYKHGTIDVVGSNIEIGGIAYQEVTL